MTRTRLKKVGADLLVRWPRTLLTLLGLSVGLFGVGAVLIAYTILASDLDENFRRTDPPNVVIRADNVTPAAITRLRALPGVTAVENRPGIPARIEIGLGRWMPMNLFVVEDFRRMDVARFYPQPSASTPTGFWPPPQGSLLIERSGRFFIRERAGTPMRLRIGGGLPLTATLAGSAFDPGQAPSPMDQVIYGYVTPQTWRAWSGSAPPARLLLRVDTGRVSAATIAGRAERLLVNSGASVRRVESFETFEHPHQFQLNSIVAMLAALAAFSLVMCVVLTVNLVDAVMAGEQRSIGVMRAVGARRRQIVFDYVAGAAVLGLVAAALTLPFSLSVGRGIARFAAMVVNFDLLAPRGPAGMIPFVLVVATAIPALVAAYRVWRATRVPVRDALAPVEPGQGTAFGERFGALLAPLPLLQRIAVRSLARRPRRVLLTASILALGVAFFMTALNTRESMLATVDLVQRTKPYDLAITMAAAYPEDEIATWLGDFPTIRRWEAWSLAEGNLMAGGVPATNPLPVHGVPAGSIAIHPDVLSGRWLSPQDREGIVVSQGVVNERPAVQVGARFRLRVGTRELPVEVIGVVKEFGAGLIYAPRPLLQALGAPVGRSNQLMVTLNAHDVGAQTQAIAELEESVAASDWQIATIRPTRWWEQVILAHLVDIGRLLKIIAGIALFIGAMGLASSISVGVVERYREIAVLKAIGARSRAIAIIFASEAVLIALIGAGFAILLAPWFSRAVSDAFGSMMIEYPFDYRAAPGIEWMALGVAAAIALVACILPVRAAIRMTIRQALRTE